MIDVLAADRIETFRSRFRGAHEQIRRIIVGNDDVVQGIITCLLARGHGLLEGIPGVARRGWSRRAPMRCT